VAAPICGDDTHCYRRAKDLVAFFRRAGWAVTDDFDEFAKHDVIVLPISVDSTASLKEFKTKYDMKTDLLSDFRRDVSRAYGVLNEERFYSNRAYFLVDRAGIVRWAHVEALNAQRRENAEILAEISKLS